MKHEEIRLYFKNLKKFKVDLLLSDIENIIDMLELNGKYNKYLKFSRYETSFDVLKNKPIIRFIHYPYFSEDLTKTERKLIGKLEAKRIFNILSF